MADIVDKKTRSRMMSGIRGKNTKPELRIRKGLFSRGFRYRLHDKRLPGKPDLVLPRHNAVVFIHGCFWHGHKCHLFKWPKTRKRFWVKKILANRKRDRQVLKELTKNGWRTLVIWECSFRDGGQTALDCVCRRAAGWIRSRSRSAELGGAR